MNRKYNHRTLTLTLILSLGMMCCLLLGAVAQEKRPHYMHALADVRYARAWLYAPGSTSALGAEHEAIEHINKAMRDIQRALADDGKEPGALPPTDANLKHKDRLAKAVALLQSAVKDLRGEERDKAARDRQRSASRHVEEALRATRQAIVDSRD